jgi:hypothetical protein
VRDLWQSGFAKGNAYTAKVRVCALGYLSVSATTGRQMAKIQRVPQRASLIYKTVFLLVQKEGHNLEPAIRFLRRTAMAGEKTSG